MTIWKDNLGDLSREIRHLQDQSTSMGIKLNNRRSVREYLSQLVDELLIPEEMIEVRVQTFHTCDCNIYAWHNASLKLCCITYAAWWTIFSEIRPFRIFQEPILRSTNTDKPTGTRIKIFGMIFSCNDAFDSYSRCKVIFNMHLNIYAHATQITLFYEIFRYTLAIYPDQGWL